MGDRFTFPNLTYMLECLVSLVQISNIYPLRRSTGEILPLNNEDSTCITTEVITSYWLPVTHKSMNFFIQIVLSNLFLEIL